jgi:hypothetical protein
LLIPETKITGKTSLLSEFKQAAGGAASHGFLPGRFNVES